MIVHLTFSQHELFVQGPDQLLFHCSASWRARARVMRSHGPTPARAGWVPRRGTRQHVCTASSWCRARLKICSTLMSPPRTILFHAPCFLARQHCHALAGLLANTRQHCRRACQQTVPARCPRGCWACGSAPGTWHSRPACGRMARQAPAAAGVLNGELRPERLGPRSRGTSFVIAFV